MLLDLGVSGSEIILFRKLPILLWITFDKKRPVLRGEDQPVLQPDVAADHFLGKVGIDASRFPWPGLQRADGGEGLPQSAYFPAERRLPTVSMQVHASLWITHRDGTPDGASQQRPAAGAEGEHMARIVILGGTGYAGGHLAQEAADRWRLLRGDELGALLGDDAAAVQDGALR